MGRVKPEGPLLNDALRDLLRTERTIPFCELEDRFEDDPDGLRETLESWEKDGTIRRYNGGCGGGWCEACETGCSEMIAWNGE